MLGAMTLPTLVPLTAGALAPSTLKNATHLNLAGDYRYMGAGYYASLDAELEGLKVLPTTADALDAYVVPIALEKARLAHLATPHFDIVTDKFPPLPVLAYAINPFSTMVELVSQGDDLAAKFKALTMTGKYATLCQRLPDDYRLDVVRCVLGHTLVREYAELAEKLFAIFRLPLMRVRVIVTTSDYLFSAIEPLPFDELTLNEKRLLRELAAWPS